MNKRYYDQCYYNIIQRCYNPEHSKYENYGGRGITMYEPWRNDYQLFLSYVTSLPQPPGTSLDRRCNDYGYHPMNLRFATPKQQKDNQRKVTKQKAGQSGYKWVTPWYNNFVGKYKHNGVWHYVGSFPTAEEAYAKVCEHRLARDLPV